MAITQRWFHTESEANAFIEGVSFVNDSAVCILGCVQEGEDGTENAWRVDVQDDDAQEPIDFTEAS